MSILHKTNKMTTSVGLTFALLLVAGCGTPNPTGSSSSSSSTSSSPSSSSSSLSSSSSSSSSSTPRVFPTGSPVSTSATHRPDQQPAFKEQTKAPEDHSPLQPRDTIIARLDNPWGIAFVPDGRMLITEKAGKLKLVTQDGSISDISGVPTDIYYSGSSVIKQAGFMDVAISPDFESDRMVYFTYAKKQSGNKNQITIGKARLSDDWQRLENFTDIFKHEPAWASDFNIGSRLAFDNEGMIYASIGDHYDKTAMQLAQDVNAHIGKIVRINTDGSSPSSNPFASTGGLPEIWSYGHRNIQGIAIHPDTGLMWSMEHGPQGGDEINRPQKGKNYGWPIITYGEDYFGAGPIGDNITKKAGMEQPIYYFDPVIAPGGIAFYEGEMFKEWNGDLLLTSLSPGGLVRVMLDGEKVKGEERYFASGGRFRDVAVGPDGAIWIVTDSTTGQKGKLIKATLQ